MVPVGSGHHYRISLFDFTQDIFNGYNLRPNPLVFGCLFVVDRSSAGNGLPPTLVGTVALFFRNHRYGITAGDDLGFSYSVSAGGRCRRRPVVRCRHSHGRYSRFYTPGINY